MEEHVGFNEITARLTDTAVAVTIAIPVYNSAATLERCVRSALGQTLQDVEIIIADDGSTDGTLALARRLATEDARIGVLAISPNGGKPAAMNRIAAKARGRWLAVLDADDAFHPGRLERLVSAGEAAGADLVADNLVYVDAGADAGVRTAFATGQADRRIAREELIAHSNSYAEFDFGILKPVLRMDFLRRHGIGYCEETRLSEDFYYLVDIFAAGGVGLLVSEALYFWTMPFGAISRQWTETGAGAWRYDYRPALRANARYIERMRQEGHADLASMLVARAGQYRTMIHYLDAQRLASEGAWVRSVATIAGHPRTYRLLLSRIYGRVRRRFVADPAVAAGPLPVHPSLRAGVGS